MQSKTHKSPTALSCRHLKKTFDQLEIFKDITFSIRKGEKVGVVGPNGSGKTTLFKILTGLVGVDSGTVTYTKNITPIYLPQVHEESEGGLSGGELARKVLEPILSTDANFFLLDEPTNNLDTEGLEVMEEFVQDNKNTFVIISHDRMFLDRTVTKIIEIDPHSKSTVIYDGNYSFYAKEKAMRIEREWNTYTDTKEKSKKLSQEMSQRLSWMKKIEKTRHNIKKLSKNEREKPVAARLRDKEGRMGRRAKIIKDRLRIHEDSAVVTKPIYELPLKITFEALRGSTKVFEIQEVKKKWHSKTIGPFTFSVQYGERIHITGKNGAGKSTLLKLILDETKPDSGEMLRGENVQVGYLEQSRSGDVEGVLALEHFLENTKLQETVARKVLNRFRITSEDVKKKMSNLSPGEYSRLLIAELFALQPNCIILDEPSNHLDLEVLEEFENALANFTGTLIVVSHDRYFSDKLNLSHEINLD